MLKVQNTDEQYQRNVDLLLTCSNQLVVRINDKKILSKFELLFLFFHLFSLYLVIHFIFLFNSFISEIS